MKRKLSEIIKEIENKDGISNCYLHRNGDTGHLELNIEFNNGIAEGRRNKMSWVPITKNYVLDDEAIVTRKIKSSNPLDVYVTIGLPGWGLQNGTIAYMPLPKNINEEPEAWKSEYRGDELPAIKESKRFIVQLQGSMPNNQSKTRIMDLCLDALKSHWLAVPKGWEVIAWMEFPKPYREK